jgi:hypothetical protein
VLVFPLIDDVQDVLAELHVMIRPLKQETVNTRHVRYKLIMLPRDIESRFRAAYSDAERGVIDKLDLLILALP